MKRITLATFIVLFLASAAFAAEFAPTLLKLSAPQAVHYDFDGSQLEIPVTVKGTPANTVFMVYTKGQADGIGPIQNGYLGWHHVNKIDTCMYCAPPQLLDEGDNTILWNGKDDDGNLIGPGEYTYYLWGYDSVNAKVYAVPLETASIYDYVNFVTHDYQGNPYTRPVIYGKVLGAGSFSAERTLIRQKWSLGNDPSDESLIETTSYTAYNDRYSLIPSPYELDKFYHYTTTNALQGHIRKWTWVPNGNAVRDTQWATNGEFVHDTSSRNTYLLDNQDMRYVGNDLLAVTNTGYDTNVSELVMVSAKDGTEQYRIDLSKWWVNPEDYEKGGIPVGGPSKMDVVNDTYLFLGAHGTCANQMIVPTGGVDEEDWNRWVNLNGDYVGDHNFAEDSERPWVCHDVWTHPYKYQFSGDAHLFSAFIAYTWTDYPTTWSFGLYAPDGTGIGNFSYAGETTGRKNDIKFVDYGSAYDGIYSDNESIENDKHYWFVAHDSFKGTLTSAVSVDDGGPQAFSVSQNSPNPFNPSTTIYYTLAEAGDVSIEIFNVAGQRVDTIANEFMSVGSHSVTWDASGFSAGVYFYTVKTGDFSKTMKMTLLK